jgi:WD40 repeat protein
VATVSWDGTTRVWEAASGRNLAILETGLATSVAFGEHNAIALASAGVVQVWDVQSRMRVRTIDPQIGDIRHVSFHPPTGMWSAAGASGDARVWDSNWELRQSLNDPDGGLSCAVLDPAGRRLITTSSTGKAILWDLSTGAPVPVLRSSGPSLNVATFSRDGMRVVAGSWDKTARIWDTTSGTEVFALRGHELAVIAVGFDAADGLLASFGLDGNIRIWDGSPR